MNRASEEPSTVARPRPGLESSAGVGKCAIGAWIQRGPPGALQPVTGHMTAALARTGLEVDRGSGSLATVLATVPVSNRVHRWPSLPLMTEGSRGINPESPQLLTCGNAALTIDALSDAVLFVLVCRPSPYHLATPPQRNVGARVIAQLGTRIQLRRVQKTLALQVVAIPFKH